MRRYAKILMPLVNLFIKKKQKQKNSVDIFIQGQKPIKTVSV